MRAVVTCIEPEEVAPRSLLAANAITGWLLSSPRLGNAVMLMPAAEPLPCRLSTQQLVELLKMPTCIGEARRVILDQLGNRYRRPFADVWEFVRFAEEQQLGLDLTSPPQKPEPAVALPPR